MPTALPEPCGNSDKMRLGKFGLSTRPSTLALCLSGLSLSPINMGPPGLAMELSQEENSRAQGDKWWGARWGNRARILIGKLAPTYFPGKEDPRRPYSNLLRSKVRPTPEGDIPTSS